MIGRFARYLGRHHWGLVATFLAMGGTAYAVASLPPNSVGTRQIRQHAVTLSKISPGAQKVLRGRIGPTGPSNGYYAYSTLIFTGFTGPEGASVTVPPGDYIATGGCTASQSNATGQDTSSLSFGMADAILRATPTGQTPTAPYLNEPNTFSSTSSVPNEGYSGRGHGGYPVYAGAASLSNSGGFSLPSGGTITETCQDDSTEPPATGTPVFGGSVIHLAYSGYYLTAIRVADIQNESASTG